MKWIPCKYCEVEIAYQRCTRDSFHFISQMKTKKSCISILTFILGNKIVPQNIFIVTIISVNLLFQYYV